LNKATDGNNTEVLPTAGAWICGIRQISKGQHNHNGIAFADAVALAQSSVDVSFWSELGSKKLDEYQLSETPIDITGA
jgi:hypothetical protein